MRAVTQTSPHTQKDASGDYVVLRKLSCAFCGDRNDALKEPYMTASNIAAWLSRHTECEAKAHDKWPARR